MLFHNINISHSKGSFVLRVRRRWSCSHSALTPSAFSISIHLLEARRNGPGVAVAPENVGAVPSTRMVTASCSPSPTGTPRKFQRLMRVRHLTFGTTAGGIHRQLLSSLIPTEQILRPHVRCFTASQNNAASDFSFQTDT